MIYHLHVHPLARQLSQKIRKDGSIKPGDRVVVAVSGGADSVALLSLLLELRTELGIVLSVAHVNHKLRGEESDADEQFVADLARSHDLELHLLTAPVDTKHHSGIEASARTLRYDFFHRLARESHATVPTTNRVLKIATAHTVNDQAETVLMRLFRGTGIRGLAGIHPHITFKDKGVLIGEVARPLLSFQREALRAYLHDIGQGWREDSSNQDVTFLRNRIRHRLLPQVTQDFGVSVIGHLADLAEIARAEEEHWYEHCEIVSNVSNKLSLNLFHPLPLAAQRRLLRAWLETNARDVRISFRLIEEVLALAGRPSETGTLTLELPVSSNRQWLLRRTHNELIIEPTSNTEMSDYEYLLPVPGQVSIPKLGLHLEAQLVDPRSIPDSEHDQLLDPARVPRELTIRNWRAGDRFWPDHTASEKKVKELLTARHIAASEKKFWPVAAAPDLGIVWMRGFPTPASLHPPKSSARAIWLREIQP